MLQNCTLVFRIRFSHFFLSKKLPWNLKKKKKKTHLGEKRAHKLGDLCLYTLCQNKSDKKEFQQKFCRNSHNSPSKKIPNNFTNPEKILKKSQEDFKILKTLHLKIFKTLEVLIHKQISPKILKCSI